MALPVLNAPISTTTLPVSGREVEYRPFLVKEEKILIIAESSGEEKDMIAAVHQIVNNCTFGKVDTKKLCATDLEWLILQIRAKAKGYTTTLSFRCENEVDGEKCGMVNDIDVDLHDVKVTEQNENNVIELTPEVGIKMAVPSVEVLSAIENSDFSEVEKHFLVLYAHIESIYDNDQVWLTKDLTKDEIADFVDSFSDDQMKEIENWISSTQQLYLDVKYRCAQCGATDTIRISGIDSFFD